jgi:hypothetical protein
VDAYPTLPALPAWPIAHGGTVIDGIQLEFPRRRVVALLPRTLKTSVIHIDLPLDATVELI